jgi:hypothetical protein
MEITEKDKDTLRLKVTSNYNVFLLNVNFPENIPQVPEMSER